MRRQLTAIVVMGVLSLVLFGGMANYYTGVNPRVKLKGDLERTLPVTITSVDLESDRTRRVVDVQGKPRDGARPDDALLREVARRARDIYAGKGIVQVRVTHVRVSLEGAETVTFSAGELLQWDALERMLGATMEGLEKEFGLKGTVAPSRKDDGTIGAQIRSLAPLEDPDAVARSLYRRVGRRLRFVRVSAPGGPDRELDAKALVAAPEARSAAPAPEPAPAPAPAEAASPGAGAR